MEIKFYSEEPFPDSMIIETYHTIYKRSFNLDYWKWRYFNNPFEKAPNIAYIESDGKLACFYAVSETLFNKNGELIKCGLMNSAMTHPDFAGQGLFSNLEQVLHKELFNEKGLDFVFGFANHNAHRIHRKYAGWKDIFILNHFYGVSADILMKSSLSSAYQFETTPAHIDNLDIFKNMSFTDSDFSFQRNDEFIKWRIIDNPVKKYNFLKILNGPVLNGILIYKEYQGSIDIMEFFYKDKEHKYEVLKQGLTFLASCSKGIFIWSNLFMDEHIFLESLSFREKEFNTYFGYISDKINLSREKLHFRFLDSDVF